MSDAIKINLSGLYTRSLSQWGYVHSYSHTIFEDRMRSYMPRYLESYDGSGTDFTDGTLTDDEIPDFYGNWLTTDGLQTEDVNGNGILDAGEDYNGNGKIDEVRISNIARSADWLWADQQTMANNSSFTSYIIPEPGILIVCLFIFVIKLLIYKKT